MIDDEYVQQVADRVLNSEQLRWAPSDLRADLGHDLALIIAGRDGLTDASAAELARKVKNRIQWTLFAKRGEDSSN